MVGGFLLSLLFTLVSLGVVDYYMSQLFGFTLTSHLFANRGTILLLFIIEIMVIVSLLMGISYAFVSKLHKSLK